MQAENDPARKLQVCAILKSPPELQKFADLESRRCFVPVFQLILREKIDRLTIRNENQTFIDLTVQIFYVVLNLKRGVFYYIFE